MSQTFTKSDRAKDHRGVNLISDALQFGRLWYGEPNAISQSGMRCIAVDHIMQSQTDACTIVADAGAVLVTLAAYNRTIM
jgi:hypothetical protein